MADFKGSDLDKPLSARRRSLFNLNDDTIGAGAEAIARFFGTGTYLMWQTVFVLIWIALNAGAWWWAWDPYPFILLNLAFSTQAAYAAPLILLAQNRQEDRNKVQLAADRRRDDLTKADTEFLARELASVRHSLGETVSRDYLRRELDDVKSLLERIESKLDDAAADDNESPSDLHEPIQGDLEDRGHHR